MVCANCYSGVYNCMLITFLESYLKTRPDAKFDRADFDCLSNKFLSKLVIRAN